MILQKILATRGLRPGGDRVAVAMHGYRGHWKSLARDVAVNLEFTTPKIQAGRGTSSLRMCLATKGYKTYGDRAAIGVEGFRRHRIFVGKDIYCSMDVLRYASHSADIPYDYQQPRLIVLRDATLSLDVRLPVIRSAVLQLAHAVGVIHNASAPYDARTAVIKGAVAPLDMRLRIVRNAIILLENAAAWGVTAFLHPGGSVHFRTAPIRPGKRDLGLNQVKQYGSDGTLYIYSKGNILRVTHLLIFPRLDDATFDQLRSFRSAVGVVKGKFTWYDHENQVHTVRFGSTKLSWRKVGYNQTYVEIPLVEDLAA